MVGRTDRAHHVPAWQLWPFAVLAAAALPLSYLPPSRPNGDQVLLAAVVTVVAFGLARLASQAQPSRWVALGPPLLYLVAVAVLRDAEGGAASGYGPLVLIPLVWVALHGDRTQVFVVSSAIGLLFLVPILRWGAPDYPASEWRRFALWVMVAPTVGLVVNGLVRRIRDELDARQRRTVVLETVAGATRRLSDVDDVRRAICSAVLDVCTAHTALLVEADASGSLAVVASAGAPASSEPALEPDEEAVALAVLATGTIGRGERRRCHPVRRGEATVGALVTRWHGPVAEDEEAVLDLLAAETGLLVERSDLLASLRRVARTDTLTGLDNRRSFDELFERERARATRSGDSLTVVMLDIDRFKAYNDQHGHQGGDELLATAAREWGRTLRAADVLARWGGEEFVVLLPGASREAAEEIVGRLRAATPFGQTCSAGVAVWDGVEGGDAVVARADRALYAAKDAGRDRTVFAD